MVKDQSSKYAEAGVDIDKGNAFVDRIKPIVAATHQPEVLTGIGGFSSLFDLNIIKKFERPVLVSSTDGVGTKLTVAGLCNKHDTIGIDLVAMCVNDLVVGGARPLFFLDYFSVGKLDLDVAMEVVKGIAKGCKQAGCSLVGGETAEMPGLYNPGDYDLAGFTVGIVDRDKVVDGSKIKVGNKIIGLASSGLHSNGYSLVRKIFFEELGLTVDDYVDELGCTVGEELLRPTRIYVQSILRVLEYYSVNGMVHNTGGGFFDNIPRIIPDGLKAVVDPSNWQVPAIFPFLQDKGNIPMAEMFRTFNAGIGLMLFVGENCVYDIMRQLERAGETPFIIGDIVGSADINDKVEISNLDVFTFGK